MHSRAADLDCHDRVQRTYSSLEGFEVTVLIRKDAELSLPRAIIRRHSHAYTCMSVLFRRFEPRITLGLNAIEEAWRKG